MRVGASRALPGSASRNSPFRLGICHVAATEFVVESDISDEVVMAAEVDILEHQATVRLDHRWDASAPRRRDV